MDLPTPSPSLPSSSRPIGPTLSPSTLAPILSYLSLPPSPLLPLPPAAFLSTHLSALPPPLLRPFSNLLSPRARAHIRGIKARRLLWAQTEAGRQALGAGRGRRRWPLLWERMGGAPVVPGLDGTGGDDDDDNEGDDKEGAGQDPETEEQHWASRAFLGGQHQQVRKLGGFLRGLEEEREGERVRARKREERHGEEQGEEFDSSDDDGDAVDADGDGDGGTGGGGGGGGGGSGGPSTAGRQGGLDGPMAARRQRGEPLTAAEEAEVRALFERRLLELFLDGLDTIDYDPIDYVEPPGGDPIAQRDEEDAYFDEQLPGPHGTSAAAESGRAGVVSGEGKPLVQKQETAAAVAGTDNAVHDEAELVRSRLQRGWDGKDQQNGQGEYDY